MLAKSVNGQVIDASSYSQSGTYQSFTRYGEEQFLSISSYKTRLSVFVLNQQLDIVRDTSYRLASFVKSVAVQEGISGHVKLEIKLGKGRSTDYQVLVLDSMLNQSFSVVSEEKISDSTLPFASFSNYQIEYSQSSTNAKGIMLAKKTVDPNSASDQTLWHTDICSGIKCLPQDVVEDENDDLFVLALDITDLKKVKNDLFLFKINGGSGKVEFKKRVFLNTKRIYSASLKMVDDQIFVEGNYGKEYNTSEATNISEGLLLRIYDKTSGQLQLKAYYPNEAIVEGFGDIAVERKENARVKFISLNATNSGYVGFLYCSTVKNLAIDSKRSEQASNPLSLKRVQFNFKGQASIVETQGVKFSLAQGVNSYDHPCLYIGDQSYKEGYLWPSSAYRKAIQRDVFKSITNGKIYSRRAYYSSHPKRGTYYLPKDEQTLYKINVKESGFKVFQSSP